MPTLVYSTTNHIQLTGLADSGTELTWTGTSTVPRSSGVVDFNDDGNIDSTGAQPDYYWLDGFHYTGYTIEIGGNAYAIFENTVSPGTGFIPFDVVFEDISVLVSSGAGSTMTKSENSTPTNFCFAAGSLIATPDGERAVEALTTGDLITTADGRTVPVKWVGHQTHSAPAANLRLPTEIQPVRIRAGALGAGLPHSDLTVTADHGMVFSLSSSEKVGENNGYVVNASALINGSTIDWVPMDELEDSFTVYHIETEAHDVILANGAPSETFIDAAGRAAFDNHQEYLTLYGAERIIPELQMPRISTRRLVPQTLRERLGITEDPSDVAALTA